MHFIKCTPCMFFSLNVVYISNCFSCMICSTVHWSRLPLCVALCVPLVPLYKCACYLKLIHLNSSPWPCRTDFSWYSCSSCSSRSLAVSRCPETDREKYSYICMCIFMWCIVGVYGVPAPWGPNTNSKSRGGPSWNGGGEESTDNIILGTGHKGGSRWNY